LEFGHWVFIAVKNPKDFWDIIIDCEDAEAQEAVMVCALQNFCNFPACLEAAIVIVVALLLLHGNQCSLECAGYYVGYVWVYGLL